MKKVLSVLIAVAMLAAVCSIGLNAVSYAIPGSAEARMPAGTYGGSCYDTGRGAQANAWASDPRAWNSVELDGGSYGEWFDHGIYQGDIADAYSIVVASLGAYEGTFVFSYYAWGNYAR